MLFVLALLPRTAEASKDPVESILRGEDVVVPFGTGAKQYKVALIPPHQLLSLRADADPGRLWMFNGRPGRIDLGAGQSIGSSESFGIFGTLTGQRFKNKHDPSLLSDAVVDASPGGWFRACTPDGNGHVAIVADNEWPLAGFPAVEVFKKYTSVKVGARAGRYVCATEKGMLGLLASVPQGFVGGQSRPAWPALVPRRPAAEAALDMLSAKLPVPPVDSASDESADDGASTQVSCPARPLSTSAPAPTRHRAQPPPRQPAIAPTRLLYGVGVMGRGVRGRGVDGAGGEGAG